MRLAWEAALATTVWGAALLKSPFLPVAEFVIDWCDEWLANRGLIFINVGAFYIDNKFDQSSFDKAMADGLARIPTNLTAAQKKVIDDAVINAFRRFGRVSRAG